MNAVVLRPHSQTNHSEDFLVVDYNEWAAHVFSGRRDFTIHSRHKSYDAAADACNSKNENEGDNA